MDAIEMHRQQMPVRLLGWDDLRAKGIKDSKPTIYRKIKAGRFPAPDLPRQKPCVGRTRSRRAPSVAYRTA